MGESHGVAACGVVAAGTVRVEGWEEVGGRVDRTWQGRGETGVLNMLGCQKCSCDASNHHPNLTLNQTLTPTPPPP